VSDHFGIRFDLERQSLSAIYVFNRRLIATKLDQKLTSKLIAKKKIIILLFVLSAVTSDVYT